MFYHASTCSSVAMCYTWVWAMSISSVACHSIPLCLPSLCSGRVPCVFVSGLLPTCWHACQTLNTETISWIFGFSLKCDSFSCINFLWGLSMWHFGKCFQFKPQQKQPNWSLDAVISLCRGCHFWLKMCGKFRAPTLPGTPHTFSIF